MVLKLRVDNFYMHRILIDPRSSTNLLRMLAYRQIGYFLSALENPSQVLTGFNKASRVSLSDVILPVQASLITIQHYYRTGVTAQNGSHPSTYHQMVSYLTEIGQVDLLGS